MAEFKYERLFEGTSISGKVGESMRIPERWQIRVDTNQFSKADLLRYVSGTIGVTYGSPHWELAALRAQEFDLSPVGRDGLRWILTVHYYVPQPGKEVTANQIPDDVWERGGGVTTVPVFTDTDGETICNAAGDPLEGLSRERPEKSWSLTRCYETDEDLEDDVSAADGKVNQAGPEEDPNWAEGEPHTWKCYFKGAKKVSTNKLDGAEDGGLLEYIQAQWEFRYDPETWQSMPWDVGFMELVDEGSGSGGQPKRRAITGSDNRPVKQPVGLDAEGHALPPGTPPGVIRDGDGAQVYEEADFHARFGTPRILPPGGPG
jgi:hypothetical protein